MNAISNWEEVPLFDREEAEAAFWADNRIDVRLMESSVAAASELSDSVTITLRMDPRMLARIKRLARTRYLNYQSMIKQWLSERMEHEVEGKGVRAQNGFTLIEILVVITIMGIIAAMVLTGGQYASKVKKETAVKAMREKLQLMIDNYQAKLNYYPPDNGNLASTPNPASSTANATLYDQLTATNPLLYELTGATNTNNNTTAIVFNGNQITLFAGANAYTNFFNRGAIANADASEPQNFCKPPPKPQEYTNYPPNTNFQGFVVPVPLTGSLPNFWHYDSSSPWRHNQNSYDLWAEFLIGNKNGAPQIETNGNW
jgi:prepilin-type N-terminal cleavage/methylation domain-containing protein